MYVHVTYTSVYIYVRLYLYIFIYVFTVKLYIWVSVTAAPGRHLNFHPCFNMYKYIPARIRYSSLTMLDWPPLISQRMISR